MNKNVFSKVFLWMFIGLLVTFGVGYYVSTSETMLDKIFSSQMYWLFLIAELVVVIFLSARIHKMQPMTAKISFILYSFLTGLTFSSIFVVYNLTSILFVFLIAAGLFGLFALIGAFTKVDLTKLGTILMMMLLGIIVCVIVNMFVGSETFDLVLSSVSVIVFLGFTAYDIQKIKRFAGELPEENFAIYGALQLYLDFINIFLDLLNLFGSSKD